MNPSGIPPWLRAFIREVGTHYLANELSERTDLPGTGHVDHGTGLPSAGGGTDVLGLGRAIQAIALFLLAVPFICILCSGLSLLIGIALVWILPALLRFIGWG